MNIATKIKILFLSVTLFLLPSLSGAEMSSYNLDVISSQSDYAFFTTTNAINDLGQVVGVGQVGSTQYPLSWNIGDGFTTLTNPGVAGGINNLGQFIISNPFRVYDSDGTELYSHDVYDGIGTDINNNTEVAGATFFNGSLYYCHAFLWNETNGMEDLGTLGGDTSYAKAINDSCKIVGHSTMEAGLQVPHFAFLWSRESGMYNLGTLPGLTYNSSARDINNNGKVVGYSQSRTDGRAFIWDSETGMQSLGSILGRSDAIAINDSDIVVGNCSHEGIETAFIWSGNDGMCELSGLLSSQYADYNILKTYDINNNNQIVALAELDGVEYHVLLTPVPEPISLLMLTMGSFAVLRRKANRGFFH